MRTRREETIVRESEPRGRWSRSTVATAGFALGALLGAVACSGGDDETAANGGVRVTVDSTGGVYRTTNSGTPPAWRLEPLLTVERAGSEEFGAITGVMGDWGGNVYVADAHARRIYRFDDDGALIATLGGEGAGPGEFRAMQGLAFVGGKLAALDAGNARISLLPPDGQGEAQSVRWQALTGDVTLEQTAPGEAYAPISIAQPGERVSRRRLYLRLIGAGNPDTLAPVEALWPSVPGAIVCERPAEGSLRFFGARYAARGLLALAPGQRVLVGHSDRYHLALVSPAGDTLRVIARDVAPAAITDAEWAVVEREWTEFQANTRGDRCNESGITRPAAKPAFASAFFDDVGRLWVEAWETEGFRFDVFDSTGVLVGSMPAPARDRAVRPYVRAGRLLYVTLDSLDVPAVRVARIVEGPAADTAGR